MAYLFLVRERWYAVRTLRGNRANYRRCYVPGGSFFFTVVTERRAAMLGNDVARDYLRAAFRDCRQRWPLRVDALVMLPDHLHALWTLPPDDADYSKRWGAIKKHFTPSWLAAGGNEQPLTDSRHRSWRSRLFPASPIGGVHPRRYISMGFPPKAGYGLTPEPALKSRVGRAPDTPDIPANPPNPSGNAALMPDLLCYNRPPRLSKGEAHDAFRPYRYQS